MKAKLTTKEKVISPSEHWQGLVPTETAVIKHMYSDSMRRGVLKKSSLCTHGVNEEARKKSIRLPKYAISASKYRG